jgi:hypothetical protein
VEELKEVEQEQQSDRKALSENKEVAKENPINDNQRSKETQINHARQN